MTTSSIDEFLTTTGGGDRNSASFAFSTPGAVVTGTITEIGEKVQQTEFGKGTPKVDKNGKPVWMVPVTIETTLRNWEHATNPPSDEATGALKPDVGLRTLWLRYKLRDAVASAVQTSGGKFREGGTLAVKYTTQSLVNGFNVKEYEARYTPPSAADDFLAATPTAPAPAAASGNNGWDDKPPF